MTGRCRCLLVWVALTAVAVVTGREAWPGGGLPARFDEVVVAVAGLALVACATWAWLVGTVVVVQALRDPVRAARSTRGVPAWVTRAVLLACGLAAVAVPAQASDDVQHLPGFDPRLAPAAAASVDGLPYPDRATGPAAPAAPRPDVGRADRTPAAPTGPVVVRPGDSLWRIAEELLGGDADPARVAEATRRLVELNREVIGPDPDLIHPGLRLRTPGS